jgi:hypothetical protein
MYLFVFTNYYNTKIAKTDLKSFKAGINYPLIEEHAKSAKFYSALEDGWYHQYAKICQALDNKFDTAILLEVSDDTEAKWLIENHTLLTIKSGWARPKLRYIYDNIDYDELASTAIMILLSKSDDDTEIKERRRARLSNITKYKKVLTDIATPSNNIINDVSQEFLQHINAAVAQIDIDHAIVKEETKRQRKEADMYKVQLRAKLNKYVFYNSNSKRA